MKYVPKVVTRSASMTKLHVTQNSPKILFVAGVAGVVGSTVLACRATLKLEGILTEAEKLRMDAGVAVGKELDNGEIYTEEDRANDTKVLGIQTGVKIAKAYAPAVTLGVLSIAALAGSHHILSKRNAALTTAYATLERAYNTYRARVIAEYGEEKDREFRFGKSETQMVEGPDGPVEVQVASEGVHLYERWFGPGTSKNWTPMRQQNIFFLKTAQNHCNDRLTAENFLLLNDVYEYLGFPRTREGAVVGWVREGMTDDPNSDGFVDFGIFNLADAGRLHDFALGADEAIRLDFNVDGLVYDKINSVSRGSVASG